MTVPDSNDDLNMTDHSMMETSSNQMSLSSDEVNYLVFR